VKKFVVLLSIVSAFALSAASAMAAEPIKIGFIFILSGRVGDFGMVAKQGAEVAVDQINQAGGIGGRKILGVYEDETADSENSAKAFRKLVNEDKVDAVVGIISSKVAGDLVPLIKVSRTPVIVSTAMTPVITGTECNRYTFRVTWSASQNLKAAAKLAATLKSRKWTTVGPDYALGHESWDLFQKYLKIFNPDVKYAAKSETQFAPLTNNDWSAQIKNIMSSDADGVLISLWGGNLVDFVKQANAAGFFDGKREALLTTAAVNSFISLGAELPAGLWTVAPYWHLASNSKVNADFLKAYEDKFKTEPAYQAHFAYAAVKAYAAAAEQSGSTDKEAIVNTLEGFTFEAPVGKITFRKEDHQALFDVVAGQTGTQMTLGSGRRAFRNLQSLITFQANEIAIPVEETGCSMK